MPPCPHPWHRSGPGQVRDQHPWREDRDRCGCPGLPHRPVSASSEGAPEAEPKGLSVTHLPPHTCTRDKGLSWVCKEATSPRERATSLPGPATGAARGLLDSAKPGHTLQPAPSPTCSLGHTSASRMWTETGQKQGRGREDRGNGAAKTLPAPGRVHKRILIGYHKNIMPALRGFIT